MNDSIEVYVDTTRATFHSDELYRFSFYQPLPPPPAENKKDSVFYKRLYEKGLLETEKRRKVHYKTYPLFIYNSSQKTAIVQKPIDNDLFFIVEALDSLNVWRPIEYWEQRTFLCGTGHIDYLLHPKHFIVSSVKRY